MQLGKKKKSNKFRKIQETAGTRCGEPPQLSVTGGTVVMEKASERTGEAGWRVQLSRNTAIGSWTPLSAFVKSVRCLP